MCDHFALRFVFHSFAKNVFGVDVDAYHYGVVHARVGQKLVKRNI
jgi:hypothetical protein